MSLTEFTICDSERMMAESVAAWRALRVMDQKLRAGHGDGSRDPHKIRDDHLKGAVGEMVLSKYLNVYWDPGEEDFGRFGDVLGYEVRATWHRNGHLAVYDDDPDGRKIVLVTVDWERDQRPTAVRVAGWNYALDLKTPENRRRFKDRFPESNLVCWWAPQSQLLELALT